MAQAECGTLNLIPKTMKGKEMLERIFTDRLTSLPAELLEGMAGYSAPSPASSTEPNADFKLLFAVAIRPETCPKVRGVYENSL